MSGSPQLPPDLGDVINRLSERITRLESAISGGLGADLFARKASFTMSAGSGVWQSVGLQLVTPFAGRWRVQTGCRFNLGASSWVYCAPTLNKAIDGSDGCSMYGGSVGDGATTFAEQEAVLPANYAVALWGLETTAASSGLLSISLSLRYIGQS